MINSTIDKIRIVLLIWVVLLTVNANAQCDTLRYTTSIFNSITAHENVKYGEAPVWSIPYDNTDLKMNIYTPDNDTLTKRPLMIWVHSGGFLNGNKDLEDMVALCDSFARRGYVTATIDYRKGFNPLSATSAERAVYRGVQDLRAAIRFLKEKHLDYGIDTNYTFIGGSSAGGFSTLHLVYGDQDELPESIGSGVGYPALGCLDCTGNTFVHNMDITGYVNLWGAIGDSTWISADETTPGLLIHGKADGTVPFGVGHPFGAPTTPKTQGSRSISNQLNALGIAHTTYFVEGQGHEFHGTSNGNWNNPPTAYYDTIFQLIDTHYATLLTKNIRPIEGEEIICANTINTYTIEAPDNFYFCWEVINGTIINASGNTVQVLFENEGNASVSAKQFSEIGKFNGETTLEIEVLPLPAVDFYTEENNMSVKFTPQPTGFMNYNWDFGDGAFAGSMSPTHTYIEPGIYLVQLTVINTDGCIGEQLKTMDFSTLTLVEEKSNSLLIYPNPATERVIIEFSTGVKGDLFLSDLTGKRVLTRKLSDASNQVILDVSKLTKGFYLIEIPELGVSEKLIIE